MRAKQNEAGENGREWRGEQGSRLEAGFHQHVLEEQVGKLVGGNIYYIKGDRCVSTQMGLGRAFLV